MNYHFMNLHGPRRKTVWIPHYGGKQVKKCAVLCRCVPREKAYGGDCQIRHDGMGIDEQPHSIYSLKSSSGAPKSGAM
jgi:hypothetical protein